MQPLRDDDPRELGPFTLRSRLGAGGMGVVYLAETEDGIEVAVKTVPRGVGNDVRVRLQREAHLLATIDHPRVARFVDADADADEPWLAMRYVSGPSLSDASLPLPQAQLRQLADGLAEALAALHKLGVTHRDVKPGNIIMTSHGAVLVDLGIAVTADAASMTLAGTAVGSPAWMAPEQFAGDNAGPSADVWGWAAVLTYAATGREPFGAGTLTALAHRIMTAPADLQGVPPWLLGAVQAAFTKQPERRPAAADLTRGGRARIGFPAQPIGGPPPRYPPFTPPQPVPHSGPQQVTSQPVRPQQSRPQQSGPQVRPSGGRHQALEPSGQQSGPHPVQPARAAGPPAQQRPSGPPPSGPPSAGPPPAGLHPSGPTPAQRPSQQRPSQQRPTQQRPTQPTHPSGPQTLVGRPTGPPRGSDTTRRGGSGRSRSLWWILAAAVVVAAIAVGIVLVSRGGGSNSADPTDTPTGTGGQSSSAGAAITVDTLKADGLCDSGCAITGKVPFTHPKWGKVTLVTTQATTDGSKLGYAEVAVIDSSGQSKWDYQVGPVRTFKPIQDPIDSTGHLFMTYNAGRYDGIVVVGSTNDTFGMTDYSTVPLGADSSNWRFYDAKVKDDAGKYQVVVESNDCTPSCADGKLSYTTYAWNGLEYTQV